MATCGSESPGAGEGTVFKVIFPLMSVHHELSNVDKTRPMIVPSTPTNREQSLNDLRVLVVDDEPDARELVAAVLTGSGAEVVSVRSACEALAKMAQQQFDVLVSDIGMPEMDGYALISKVRQLPIERGGRIPAAALTAYAGIEDRRRVLLAGYQMHIPKPAARDSNCRVRYVRIFDHRPWVPETLNRSVREPTDRINKSGATENPATG